MQNIQNWLLISAPNPGVREIHLFTGKAAVS